MRKLSLSRLSKRLGAGIGLTSALVVVSVASAMPASASSRGHRVDIAAVDFGYKINTHGGVWSGTEKITLWNHGMHPHQAQLFRLHHGVGFTKFKADLLGNGNIFADGDPVGGPNVVSPRGHQTVWDGLPAGTYAVVCFVAGADHIPHFVKGMISSFRIHGEQDLDFVKAPHPFGEDVEGVIKAHDLTYTMPKRIQEHGLYRFRDTDKDEAHEVTFGRLKPGKTVADARAWFKAGLPVATQPFTYQGGHGGVLPHGGGWLWTNGLEEGRYIAFCLIRDEKTGLPHAAEGMVVGFRVVG